MEEFHPENDDQAFAVLAQRFGLDIAFGHRDAVRYVETSVASHLRVLSRPPRIESGATLPTLPSPFYHVLLPLYSTGRARKIWTTLWVA